MKVGAHVGSSGGLTTAFERATELGAETIQIFGAPPQVWKRRIIRPEECAAFQAKMQETGIEPVFLHGVYLINLATGTPDQLQKSTDALCGDVKLAAAIAAKGVIFHVGSHKGTGFQEMLSQIASALTTCLKDTKDAWIILENSAGGGGSVGSKFSELGAITKALKSKRIKVCIDTQHAFAAGYNVAEKDGLDQAMEEFDREIGVENLVAVHANDSKLPLASGRDRHDNIGEGHIGRAGFETMMRHPAFADVPFLLEVPGFEPGKKGPDKKNVDILKEIRAKAAKKK